MSTYRAKVNTDVAFVSLTTLSPQPRSEGVKVTRRIPMADGSVLFEGLYVELVWDVLESAADYLTVMTVFGLHSNWSSPVTVYVRDDLFAWKRYNGVAVRPQASWNMYFPRNVSVLVRNLELLA